ncbi:hypothetical protein [Bacillus amyloliquefaciens]|uniref:hypothetical protein n=1 Tax=Bacillus amyloliquefaciens TaxID=1390 RepID=UPI0036F46825
MSIQTEQQTHSLLDAFVKVAPFLNSLIQDDITIGIYDTEKLIVNIPAKTFSLNVKPGDPLQKGDIITDAIRMNQKKTSMVPKELFGFPLIARAIPLHDENGKVIGGVGLGTSLEKSPSFMMSLKACPPSWNRRLQRSRIFQNPSTAFRHRCPGFPLRRNKSVKAREKSQTSPSQSRASQIKAICSV